MTPVIKPVTKTLKSDLAEVKTIKPALPKKKGSFKDEPLVCLKEFEYASYFELKQF
jgi:hypothetical protein